MRCESKGGRPRSTPAASCLHLTLYIFMRSQSHAFPLTRHCERVKKDMVDLSMAHRTW